MAIHSSLRSALASLAALAGGMGAGFIDVRVTEVVITLSLIFTLNVMLGAAWPKSAWGYPVLAALGVAFWNWLGGAAGGPVNPHFPRTVASYAALTGVLTVVGAAGALTGYALRRVPRIAAR